MFIFLEKDSFEENSKSSGEKTREPGGAKGANYAAVRRPYRGIQIKKDTYAVLSVRKPDGKAIPLSSSSSTEYDPQQTGSIGKVKEYSDFILQEVNEQRMEKQQIIETFGDSFVYFFGERPRMVTFSGQLMNTEDFNWRAQFWYNYEKFIRGSRLVQQNARCYIAYDTIVVEGYPLSAVAIDTADNPYQVSFQMTMLLTDYHEYSVIGSMFYPGYGQSDVDVLNIELEDERRKFVSTSAQVRRENMYASLSNQIPQDGILSALRKGMQTFNEIMDGSLLANKLGAITGLLSGRAMRVPIGVASFLTLSKEAEIAPASVLTSAEWAFDMKTQKYTSTVLINGVPVPTTTLRIAGPSRFAPSWVSKVTGTSRGMIHENYDEYPLKTQPRSLEELLGPGEAAAIMSAAEARTATMTAWQEQLSLFNIAAANGSILSTIASVVATARAGYGTILTAANIIRDPLAAVTGALGVTPQDVKRIGEGLKDGAFIPGVSWFVGGAARKSWEGWLDTVGKAQIGDVFNGFEYDPRSDFERTDGAGKAIRKGNKAGPVEQGDKSYELAYGSNDYTPLIEAQAEQDAATVEAEGDLPEGVERTEPNAGKTEDTLNEVYGNSDSAGYGSGREDPESLEEVYGQSGTIKKTTPTAEERAAMLAAVYGGDAPPSDTDTSGITASDADSAPIDPVI